MERPAVYSISLHASPLFSPFLNSSDCLKGGGCVCVRVWGVACVSVRGEIGRERERERKRERERERERERKGHSSHRKTEYLHIPAMRGVNRRRVERLAGSLGPSVTRCPASVTATIVVSVNTTQATHLSTFVVVVGAPLETASPPHLQAVRAAADLVGMRATRVESGVHHRHIMDPSLCQSDQAAAQGKEEEERDRENVNLNSI